MKLTDLLGPPRTGNYRPRSAGYLHYYAMRRPPFRLRYVPLMLRDPRIRFGLWLIKGPILAHSRFKVKSPNNDLREFIIQQVERFWKVAANRVLRGLESGFSGSEVMYKMDSRGLIHFDTVNTLHFNDVRPVQRDGEKIGIRVQGVNDNDHIFLGGMKSLWFVHGRDVHPWYGESRLSGAWEPWLDLWKDGGARDSRRLYYYKYSFDGGVLYYPVGSTRTYDGRVVPNDQLANEMLDRKATGGTMTFPQRMTDAGVQAWHYVPPQGGSHPVDMLEYITDLRDEEWEGMGIPPEVARAEGTGAYAGRAVPQDAFYAILQEVSDWLLYDANEQIFRPLAKMNFDSDDYQIVPFPLRPVEREALPEPRPSDNRLEMSHAA